MKKLILAIASLLILAGCGVGNYSVASGKSDDASISLRVSQKTNATAIVDIDGQQYNVQPIYQRAFKSERDIKKTANNTITVPNGRHKVKVIMGGNVVYEKDILLGATEHRIIEL